MKTRQSYKYLCKPFVWVVAVPVVAWFVGFRSTFILRKTCQEKQRLLMGWQRDSLRVSSMKALEWDSVSILRNGTWMESLLPVLEREKVSVVRYTPLSLLSAGNVHLEAGELILKGDFIPLVRLLDFMERHVALGKMVQVRFEVVRERAQKEECLNMSIWIMQLHETHSE